MLHTQDCTQEQNEAAGPLAGRLRNDKMVGGVASLSNLWAGSQGCRQVGCNRSGQQKNNQVESLLLWVESIPGKDKGPCSQAFGVP